VVGYIPARRHVKPLQLASLIYHWVQTAGGNARCKGQKLILEVYGEMVCHAVPRRGNVTRTDFPLNTCVSNSLACRTGSSDLALNEVCFKQVASGTILRLFNNAGKKVNQLQMGTARHCKVQMANLRASVA